MEEVIKQIRDELGKELLKRGINVKLFIGFDKKYQSFEIKSMPFETTPKIFEKIYISNSGGSRQSDPVENGVYHIYIPLDFRYELKSGGSNGSEFFNFICKEKDGKLYDISIKD